MKRPPKRGDKIRHHTPDGIREGIVDNLLSSQFVYVKEGETHRWWANYTDKWEHIK